MKHSPIAGLWAGLGIVAILLFLLFLEMVFTSTGYRFNVGAFLMESTPSMWASLGVASAIALSVFGAAR